MSATNRGAKRELNDNYATPDYAFKPIIPYLPKTTQIWEPASGDGRLVNWMNEAGVDADGCDIIRGYDFLGDLRNYAFILTNPPFSLALEFCDHAIKHADEVMMLLRLNFLGSKKRKEWFKAHEPNAIFVLSERPSFVKGKTDATEYGWFYWGFRYRGIVHP